MNISIRKQFSLLAGVLALAVITVSGLLIIGNASISRQAEQIADREFPVLNKTQELKLAVVQVQQWLTDISATRGQDGLNDGFDEAKKNAANVRRLIDELRVLDPEYGDRFQAMVPIFGAYYKVGREMAQAYVDQGPAGGNRMMAGFDTAAERMTSELNALVEDVTLRAGAAIKTQQEAVNRAQTFLWSSTLLVLVFVLALYFIIARALGRLPRVVEELRRVAEGDLSSDYESRSNDEIGQLVQAMSDMRSRLTAMMSNISTASLSLASASEEMSSITAQVSDSIQHQRSETEQVATAMNEMNATSQEVAGNIAHTADAAEKANQETGKGRRIIEEAIEGIRGLAQKIEDSSETVHQLEQHSEEITSVLDVIRGVAEQTNLLALNAAIEAARAGEQGRGFAVVADEVRTLASRTQKSTEEINKMIEKLRDGTGRAVQVMNGSREQARTVVANASSAEQSLTSIADAVSRINDMSTQIASAAEEQSAVAEEINRNIVRISEMTDQSAEASDQTAVASQDLALIASDLNGMLRQFKL